MKKMGNPNGTPGNNPKKGSSYFIEPIRKVADIKRIERALRSEPRNHLLFVMGVENGLRAGDLLKLKVGQIRNVKPGDKVYIREGKTGKKNFLGITKNIYESIQSYLKALDPPDDAFLFFSRKGDKALTTTAVNQLVTKWAENHAKLKGAFGAHTLRKTWGYHKRMQGVSWEIICKRLNHATQAVTMRYLGIEDREVEDSVLMRGVF